MYLLTPDLTILLLIEYLFYYPYHYLIILMEYGMIMTHKCAISQIRPYVHMCPSMLSRAEQD